MHWQSLQLIYRLWMLIEALKQRKSKLAILNCICFFKPHWVSRIWLGYSKRTFSCIRRGASNECLLTRHSGRFLQPQTDKKAQFHSFVKLDYCPVEKRIGTYRHTTKDFKSDEEYLKGSERFSSIKSFIPEAGVDSVGGGVKWREVTFTEFSLLFSLGDSWTGSFLCKRAIWSESSGSRVSRFRRENTPFLDWHWK